MIAQPSGPRALVVDDGSSGTGLAVIRELTSSGHVVGLANPDPRAFASRSRDLARHHPVPLARQDLDGFLTAVAEAARAYDVVIPTGDVELLALTEARSQIPAMVAAAEHEVVRGLLDKLTLSETARRCAVPTPATWLLDSPPSPLPARVAVKPRLHWDPRHPGAGATPTRLLDAAALPALHGDCDLVAQEVVTGPLTALVVVLDRDGALVGKHQQVAEAVYPVGAGNCVRGRTVPVDDDRLAGALRLLRDVGFWGVAQLEYVGEEADPPALIDVNPRPYGSMALAVAAGLAPMTSLVQVALGEQVPLRESRVGVRYSALGLDARRALQERDGGLLADLGGTLRAARGATHAVWDGRDRQPALAQWRETAGRVGRRVGRRFSGA